MTSTESEAGSLSKLAALLLILLISGVSLGFVVVVLWWL
jgi:hypothetical protein